ncbi:MAG TPA: IPT/TIG domain-containing protein [Bryobacteraceae bacterium]|nr:IPT/TIG domain-containing protein [Bryobacteraceae bacterium]
MPRLRPARTTWICVSLYVLFAACLGASTPAPSIQGVTDAAAYGPRVAPGSLASIFGSNLAGSVASATAFPLPTNLGGATVTIGGVTAPLLYASPTQINFQVPSATKTGSISLTVTGPGGTSSAYSVTVTSSAPAIFQYGTNHAFAQNASGALNADTAQAAAGSVITVYLTGIGAVNNAVPDGQPVPLAPLSTATATATATIGPSAATVQFLGLTPTFAGLAQANIVVPALPSGDYSLVITAGGYLSASAVISVSGTNVSYTVPLTLTGSAAFANTPNSTIALYGNVAYICGSNRIVMVDVTDPTNPTYAGEFGDGVLNGYGNGCSINASAATPFLVDIVGNPDNGESLAVYSLSAPESPVLLDVATTSWIHMTGLTFSGNYGFTTTSYITYYTSSDAIASQSGDFLAFDFTNPAAPVYLGMLQPSTSAGSGDLNQKPFTEVVDQAYAYVASSTATGNSTAGAGFLDVLSIATPSAPLAIDTVAVSQAAMLMSFGISGNVLLAAGNTTAQRNPGVPDFDFTGYLTLTTMDLTNVQSPAVIQTFTTSLQVNGTFHVVAFTNGVFALVNNPPDTDDFGPSMLMIVDARQPSAILLYPFQTQFGFSGLVATSTGYLLAPTILGLNVYQLQL